MFVNVQQCSLLHVFAQLNFIGERVKKYLHSDIFLIVGYDRLKRS